MNSTAYIHTGEIGIGSFLWNNIAIAPDPFAGDMVARREEENANNSYYRKKFHVDWFCGNKCKLK